MNADEITYIMSLGACVGISKYILELRDDGQRKFVSTVIGVFLVILLSGYQSVHCFISFALGSAAMLRAHPSACHLSTFLAMFTYLLFFRMSFVFGLPEIPDHTNMIQMLLTLKLSGVAFEKNTAWQKLQQREEEKKNDNNARDSQEEIEITDYEIELQSISYMEVFNYCFCYFGVLVGPYYRYRTYRDYFETPFKNHAPRVEACLERIRPICIFAVLYFFTSYMWPTSYAYTDEFYEERSLLYRLWYIYPTFFIFRMRLYGAMTLSECVCCMGGFGAYPNASQPIYCNGPKKQYLHLKRDPEMHTYNFTTIVTHNVRGVETCATFREGMKHWNVCIQYWLAVNIYKRFPIKKHRTLATLFVSTYWHGFRAGQYMCLMAVPLYVATEDMWNDLIRKDATGYSRKLINIAFWFGKFFAYSYLYMAFSLAFWQYAWRYYSSVYHVGYVIWFFMTVLGYVLMQKNKQIAKKNEELKAFKSVAEF